MRTLTCPVCSKVVEIEATYVTTNPTTGDQIKVVHAHSTVKNSELQCSCGQLL